MKEICKNCRYSRLIKGDCVTGNDYLVCEKMREAAPDSDAHSREVVFSAVADIANGTQAIVKVASDFGCRNFIEKDVYPSQD